MASVNKVIIIGNLGRDAEVRYAPSGAAIANITVATSRKWKDKTSGEMVEETEWHRCTMFDRMAEVAGEYLKKGKPVYIEGRLKTRKFNKDGLDQYSTDIIVTEMQMLGGREDGDKAPAPRASAPAPAPRASAPAKSGTAFDDMDSDVPF